MSNSKSNNNNNGSYVIWQTRKISIYHVIHCFFLHNFCYLSLGEVVWEARSTFTPDRIFFSSAFCLLFALALTFILSFALQQTTTKHIVEWKLASERASEWETFSNKFYYTFVNSLYVFSVRYVIRLLLCFVIVLILIFIFAFALAFDTTNKWNRHGAIHKSVCEWKLLLCTGIEWKTVVSVQPKHTGS